MAGMDVCVFEGMYGVWRGSFGKKAASREQLHCMEQPSHLVIRGVASLENLFV